MKPCLILTVLALAGIASADTVVLKDGRKVQGIYMGGDSRQIRIAVGDQIQSISISDAESIQFGAGAAAPVTTVTPAPKAQVSAPRPAVRAATASTAAASTTTAQPVELIPAGTKIVTRMIDDIDSERDHVGKTYRASLDEPITVDGREVVPRGADVVAKLVDDQKAGKISGKSQVTIDLVSVSINGRMVDVQTGEVTQASSSRSKQSAGVIGGTAALGAVIGAIAGGGRGAAIGAASGAGAGTAVQVLTNGPKVKIPSETRLTFTLEQPIRQ